MKGNHTISENMQITVIFELLIVISSLQGLLGLPIDRELIRVKRKGETGNDGDVELTRKVRSIQEDKEIELRHKRRFFAPDNTEGNPSEGYKSKMEARSSRSAREDIDITARRSERFRLRIRKRRSYEDESSSGSGEQADKSSTSGAGLWNPRSIFPEVLSKRDDKRSMGGNSLNSLIAALKAISSLTPEESDTTGKDTDISGSGVLVTPEMDEEDDKLPKFFQVEGVSGSGENPEEALQKINEATQNELSGEVENKNTKEMKSDHKTGQTLYKRELQRSLLADELIAAIENEKKYVDTDGDEQASNSVSAQQGRGDKDEESADTPSTKERTQGGSEETTAPDFPETPKAMRSLTDALLPDSFYRVRRSSQENFFLHSDESLGENDALNGESLVARFYRDQDGHADLSSEPTDISLASLPSETQDVFNTREHIKPGKHETHYQLSGDLAEPRVVYTRQIRDVPETIIERPAVYSRSAEESEMESSYGGEDDDEATLTIHEREIREDGYVGCFEDKSSERDLPRVLSVSHLTPDTCRTACQNAGHAYAGVQYGYLCRCGDTYGKYGKVPDEECNALCTGDKMQKCGGFWKSAIFTTAEAMQPSKRGNFFHIESVQPLTEDIFDMPRSEIPLVEDQSHGVVTLTESSKITTSPAPKEPPPMDTSDSSGSYVKEIHKTASVQESPVLDTSGVTVKQSTLPSKPKNTANEHVTSHEVQVESTQVKDDVSTAQALENESLPVNEDSAAEQNLDLGLADLPSPDPQASHMDSAPFEDFDLSPQQVTIPLESPPNQEARFNEPQRDQAPQGTHVSQLMYLHQQQDILSKPTPKAIVAVPPGDVESGTVAYTGTLKLKQSWLDQFGNGESAESKILSGNVEQAFKNTFKDEPKFVSAEVVGFREGLVKHNPNTIRKVIVPFVLTFKNGIRDVEDKLKNMVRITGKLEDMPVYKDSLQIAEYSHTTPIAKTVNNAAKEKHVEEEAKRSSVNVPNGGVDPFLKGIFSQISSEMKDNS